RALGEGRLRRSGLRRRGPRFHRRAARLAYLHLDGPRAPRGRSGCRRLVRCPDRLLVEHVSEEVLGREELVVVFRVLAPRTHVVASGGPPGASKFKPPTRIDRLPTLRQRTGLSCLELQ